MRRPQEQSGYTSVTAPGLLLGIGFGGMFDGVLLHQVLRWHHLLSSEGCCPVTDVRGLNLNTTADGIFHLFAIVLLLLGVTILWRRTQNRLWSGRQLLGLGLVGWGMFNLVEGVIDHQILGIHHVRTGPDQFLYDVGFLGFGAILVMAGSLFARTTSPRDPTQRTTKA